jgi:hypothetical protein
MPCFIFPPIRALLVLLLPPAAAAAAPLLLLLLLPPLVPLLLALPAVWPLLLETLVEIEEPSNMLPKSEMRLDDEEELLLFAGDIDEDVDAEPEGPLPPEPLWPLIK